MESKYMRPVSKKPVKEAVGYIRVSTENQAQDDKYGVDAQRQSIIQYAKDNGYIITKWYEDHISGASDRKPEWDKILSTKVDNPPFQAVIVYKNDRVARDMKLYFYYLYKLDLKNIKLISVTEDFKGEAEFANIYRALLQFVAEQERKNITRRTTAGRYEKAKKGGYCGGKAPYGYYTRNGKLYIDKEEAGMVRLVFKMLDRKIPMSNIADFLNSDGYRTRVGGYFYPSNINAIKKNRKFYEGFYKYGEMKYVRGEHTPLFIIEKEGTLEYYGDLPIKDSSTEISE